MNKTNKIYACIFEMWFSVMPPREMWYGENTGTTFEDTLSARETFSSENTASAKYIDFESNVDLSSVNSHKKNKFLRL